MRVETQNVLGTRGIDLLGATDFMFPRGIDHHRLFAGVRGVSKVVQGFARRVAGLGRLPDVIRAIPEGEHEQLDLLVVGGGQAGLSAAIRAGKRATLVDDGLRLGGALRVLDPEDAAVLVTRAKQAGAQLRSRTAAVALFREPPQTGVWALLASQERVALATARSVVLASGAHDGAIAFGNNELPGIFSARAALGLWREGVSLGERIAVVGVDRFTRALTKELSGARQLNPAQVVRAIGRSRVTGICITEQGREKRHDVNALVVAPPAPPATELAGQVGASIEFVTELGYRPRADDSGLIAERVWAAGSVLGAEGDSRDAAKRAAEHALEV